MAIFNLPFRRRFGKWNWLFVRERASIELVFVWFDTPLVESQGLGS